MIKDNAKNLMAKAKRAYEKGNHKEALSNLLRLHDLKMDLIWKFEAGKAISSLCIAKHSKAWEEQIQIIVGSEDNIVYSISMENELLWKFVAEDEITSVMASDITKDFSDEIIVGSKDCNIYVLNSIGELLWKYKIDKPIQCITATGKEGKNIIAAGTFGGAIYFLEYKNDNNLYWEYFHKNSREITGLCIANLAQDGTDELIAITDNGDIIILDYQKKLLKREMNLNTSLYGVLAKDIDNNGANEILVCSENAQVFCLDAYGHVKWQYQTKDSVYSMHCCDIDNDNDMEIILGTRDNYVYVISSQGNFKWRYQTDHNVWSIFSAPISHEKFCDLFAGLRNRNLYHYKLIDNKNTRSKIEKSYLSLLNSDQDEFGLLEGFTKNPDEYFRKFAIETMAKFASENQLRPKILVCIERLLEDKSPIVRSATIKALIKLTDYEPEIIIYKLLNKLRWEDNEDVRNSLIESIAQDYSRTIKQNRKIELLECLHILNKHWKEKDLVLNHNMFERAKEKFETGNYKEALNDFELLNKRGLDLIWKIKTKGFVCSVAAEDIDGDGFKEIAITSSKHMLYLFDHTRQQRWSNEVGGFRNCVRMDDIDGDGFFEVILGCSDGTFIIYDSEGIKKWGASINHKINCFSLLGTVKGAQKDIICGCTMGFIHCIDLTNKEKWRFRVGSHILKITVGDIDGDGFEEVIAGTLHGHLYVLDSKGKEKWAWKGSDDIASIVMADFGDTKNRSLIVGTRDGRIYTLDSKGNEKLIKEFHEHISDIAIDDVNGDGEKEIIVASQSNYISLLDKMGHKKSYNIYISSGAINCLACCDIDKDGYHELLLGAEDDYIYLYRILKSDEILKYIEDSKEKISKIENKVSFFRKEVFRFIRDNLEMNYATPKKILLLGYLGTGKSDLLWQINSGCLGEEYIPVYFSLQYMRWRDITSFLFKLSKEIIDEICDRREINFGSYFHEFEKDYEKAFDAFIEAIKLSLGNNTLLVLFDDLEKLQIEMLKGSINKDIFYFLNKLLETKRCSFIITASNRVFDLEKEYKGSFLSDAIIKDVNFVNKFDARRGLSNYLTRKVENIYDHVEKILRITGCQAHFIQVALDTVIKYTREHNIKYLLHKDWKEINRTILESVDNELLNIWDNCLPHEKLVLSCLSNLNETMSFDLDIIPIIKRELAPSACLVSGETLNETLKNLSAKSILDQIFLENEIKYTFTIGLMKDWIKENKNPFEVISENAVQLLKDLPLDRFSDLDRQIKLQDKIDFFLSTINFDRRRWDTLVEFIRIWCELSKGKEVGLYDTIEDNINELYNSAKFFCNLFGFSIEDTIDHPRLTCFKFKTPSITLKKLRDLFLIIPKYEKLDGAFYKALTGLIIDLDVASHVFLIMEFFESPGFRKFWMDSKLDLVLINSKDMKEILLSPNYLHSLLENVILKQVDLVQFSPYSTKGPAEDTMFFGRLPEIRRIERQSDKSFAIVGARQLGKTSLLLKVRNRIMDNKRIKTLYIDCEPYNDLIQLCNDILKRLSFHVEPINDIREFRSAIVENCQNENMKVTLFLDEIDPILVMDRLDDELLFKVFRSLSQEGYLNLIIAGYETLFMVTKDVKSPFFNFLEVIRLSQLDFKSAAQLILEPMRDLGIELQNKNIIVDEICKITSCFPNLIQSICKRIVEIIASEKRRKISELDIARTKMDREFQDYVVRNFYTPISELGKMIILLLTDEDEFSPNDIDNKLHKLGIQLNHSELSNEIDNLCMLSILTRYGKKYRFTIPYLSVIFKNTMEIELELEKLIEDVKQYAN